jgi:hypothetical protein
VAGGFYVLVSGEVKLWVQSHYAAAGAAPYSMEVHLQIMTGEKEREKVVSGSFTKDGRDGNYKCDTLQQGRRGMETKGMERCG